MNYANKDNTTQSSQFPSVLVLLGLGLLVFVLFFYRLGSYPLFDVDEPRYAEAAREMLERGNWITPYFNYELRFDKPVFFYWLIALSYQAFGVSEFAARLVSALAATSIVAMVYAFARTWVTTRYALFSALILTTSIQMIGLARMSITDMTLSAFMTATTLVLFMVAHRSRRWWLVAGLLAGLGVLTKGPVAIVVPGAILFLYAWLTSQWKQCFLTPWFPLALVICVAVALPWYVLAYQENGQIFIDALFLHNVTRYADTVTGHDQPAWFYLAVIMAGFLPWSPFLPTIIRYWWQEFRQQRGTATQNLEPLNWVALYAGIWIAFVFVFFTAANTKLLTYVLPLFPALALLTAATWERVIQNPKTDWLGRWLTRSAWMLFGILLIGGGVFIFNMPALLPREAATVTANQYNIVALLVLLAGTGLMAWLLQTRRPQAALLTESATFGLLGLVAIIGIVPNINQASQGDLMRYAQRTAGKPLVTYEIRKPSLTYYTRQQVPHIAADDHDKLEKLLNQHGKLYIITKNRFLKPLRSAAPSPSRLQVLENGPVYSLLILQGASSPSGFPQPNP